MTDSALKGNRIEILEYEADRQKDKRRYDIYVDPGLHILITKQGAWEPPHKDTKREVFKYDAIENEESERAEYPLRGEGIEVRRHRKKPETSWREYSIHAHSKLANRMRTALIRPDDWEDPSKPAKEGETQAVQPPVDAKKKAVRQIVQEGGTDDQNEDFMWAIADDGRMVLGYIATDEDFAPAISNTPCT